MAPQLLLVALDIESKVLQGGHLEADWVSFLEEFLLVKKAGDTKLVLARDDSFLGLRNNETTVVDRVGLISRV